MRSEDKEEGSGISAVRRERGCASVCFGYCACVLVTVRVFWLLRV